MSLIFGVGKKLRRKKFDSIHIFTPLILRICSDIIGLGEQEIFAIFNHRLHRMARTIVLSFCTVYTNYVLLVIIDSQSSRPSLLKPTIDPVENSLLLTLRRRIGAAPCSIYMSSTLSAVLSLKYFTEFWKLLPPKSFPYRLLNLTPKFY